MPHKANANPANPYLSPRSIVDGTAAAALACPLPWFCRIAFFWSFLMCFVAVGPETAALLTTHDAGTDPGAYAVLSDAGRVVAIARWAFCGLGLTANLLLLAGRREGLWPAYAFAALGAVLFAVVIVSIRASAIPLGSGQTSLLPGIAMVSLFAFLGGGSLAYYVLALHVFRHWLTDAATAEKDGAPEVANR